MTRVFRSKDADHISKHGIDLTLYNENLSSLNVVKVHVEEGHFEEFYNKVSDFVYSIIGGYGTFVLDDEKHEVSSGDLVVALAGTRIHYFGKMDMILSIAPAFNEAVEVHVRFVEKTESPYYEAGNSNKSTVTL